MTLDASSVPTTARTGAGAPRATVPGPAAGTRVSVLRAELLRHHRTFTWGASLLGLAVTAFCVRLAAAATANGLASADGRWDGNVLGWLSFYPFAVLLPLGALMGALARTRETRWREGGTSWRDVSVRRVLLARVTVLVLGSLLCQVLVIAPVLVQSLLTGEGWGPVGTWSALVVLWTVGQTAAAVWGLLAARVLGAASVGLAPAAALVLSVAGAVQAESSGWLLRPWTWFVRGQLPLLGVHGNSVNLAPGDAAWAYAVWPSLVLTAALGTVGLLLLLEAGDRRRSAGRGRRPRSTAAAVPGSVPPARSSSDGPAAARPWESTIAGASRRPSVVRALLPALPWRTWTVLAVLLLALLLVVRAVYSPTTALSTLTLVGLPVAATTVGTMTWRSVAEPWRLVLTRRGPGRLVAALSAAPSAVLGLVLLLIGSAADAGEPLAPVRAAVDGASSTVYALVTVPFVTAMLVAVSMAVTQWLGLGASIAVGVLGLLDSLVIDGNEVLTASLWRWAPWGWSAVAGQYPGTWLEIVLLSVLITVVALLVMRVGSRRAARAGTE